MIESNFVQNLKSLDKLPTSWEITEFNDIVSDNSGGNKKLAKSDFLDDGEIAIVDQGKELIGGYYNDLELAVKTKPPYIVFGDHTRVFKYIDFPFIMGADGTKVLQSKTGKCHIKYLYYFFLSINVPNTGYNRHYKYLKGLKIPLPSLETQKKIAEILDEADKLRQLDKHLIEKYDALTQSLFLDMFGDPVANVARWKVKTLSEVCLKITDGTHHSPEPMSSGFPYVTAKHVKPFKLDFEAKPSFVSEEAHNAIYSRCNPEYGDVLYIKDGATTGIACINTFKTPVSMLSSLALLKLNKRFINNQFLCHWLNHEIVKQKLISEFMSGAAIKRYTLTKIKSFKIIVPNIELQNQFAERVQAIEGQKALAQLSLQKSEDLFNSLLQKAFKGELVK